jgi:Leucine-rich repeat (LRR) protein
MMLTKLSKTILALSLALVMSTQVIASEKRQRDDDDEKSAAVSYKHPRTSAGAGVDSGDIAYKHTFMELRHLKGLRAALRRMKAMKDPSVISPTSESSSSSSSGTSSPKEESKEEARDESDVRNKHVVSLDLSLDLTRNRNLTDITFLRFFPCLTELNLLGCGNLNGSYREISQLTSLTNLNLCSTPITTKYIKSLTKLRQLSVSRCDITKAMRYIVRLPCLRELSLSGTNIDGIVNISRITTLESLKLYRMFVNDRDIPDKDVTFPALDFLSGLSRLRTLDLSNNYLIFYVKPIARMDSLTELNLEWCYSIKDLRRLRHLKSLTKLNLNGISPDDITTLKEDLTHLKGMHRLQELIIDIRVL